jgi:hypothetical protein
VAYIGCEEDEKSKHIVSRGWERMNESVNVQIWPRGRKTYADCKTRDVTILKERRDATRSSDTSAISTILLEIVWADACKRKYKGVGSTRLVECSCEDRDVYH